MWAAALPLAIAQQTSRGTVVVYPVVYSRDSGSETSRRTGVMAVREALQKAGYSLISDAVAASMWRHMGIPLPSTDKPATRSQIVRFGRAVKAHYVVTPEFDFHSRSIWVDLGPKTVSTATVDVVITDVARNKTVYTREDVSARSDEKFNAAKAGLDVLLSPLVSVVSGGPKTPHEQRAVQLAVAKAMRGWVKPTE
jgi:hypothetical protein